jgi:hypothetical protein
MKQRPDLSRNVALRVPQLEYINDPSSTQTMGLGQGPNQARFGHGPPWAELLSTGPSARRGLSMRNTHQGSGSPASSSFQCPFRHGAARPCYRDPGPLSGPGMPGLGGAARCKLTWGAPGHTGHGGPARPARGPGPAAGPRQGIRIQPASERARGPLTVTQWQVVASGLMLSMGGSGP